jgi:hypothetical protein
VPSDLIPDDLLSDPDVYNAVKQLALGAIREAQDILNDGIPAIKLQLIRSLLPQIARSLATKREDSEEKELQEELSNLYGNIAKEWGSG